MNCGKRVAGHPGGALLAALGDLPRHRQQDRQHGRLRRQRRHFRGQQIGELPPAQPAGQHEPGHRRIPAGVVAAEARVGSAVGLQALQRLHEQFGEVRFQVLDGGGRLRFSQLGQVPAHRPGLAAHEPPGPGIGEWHRCGVTPVHRPLVEPGHRRHVQVPRRLGQPHGQRPGQAVFRVHAQHCPQPVAGIERGHAALAQERQPIAKRPRVRLPGIRRGRPANREFPQPSVHQRACPRPGVVLKPEIVLDQHRHA